MLSWLVALMIAAKSSDSPDLNKELRCRTQEEQFDSGDEREQVDPQPKRQKVSRNNSITFWVTDDYAKTKQDLEQRQDINVLIGDDAPISYYSDIDLALLGHMYFITDLF